MEQTSARPASPSRVSSDQLPSAWRNGAIVLVIATAITLVVLLVAARAGMELRFERVDGRTVNVRPGIGVVSVVMTVLAGTVLLDLVGRRSARGWKAVAVAGLVIGLLSTAAPLTSAASPDVKVLLASLHVLVGITWFAVLTRASRRATGSRTE